MMAMEELMGVLNVDGLVRVLSRRIRHFCRLLKHFAPGGCVRTCVA